MENNTMCSVLELGISGSSFELLKNLCEDEGVEVVKKDTMSIILDVYDEIVTDEVEVPLQLYTEDLELQLEGSGEDAVLYGVFPIGEAKEAINGLLDEMMQYHGEIDDTEEGGEWTEEDALSFVIAVGDIDKGVVDRIQGKINTVISRTSLVFDEGDMVNMTVDQLGAFMLD